MKEETKEQDREVGGMSTRASPSATTLRGRWLVITRAAWVIIATLALGLFLASIPAYVSTVFNFGQAAWMEAPVEAPAGVIFVFDLVAVLGSIASALVCSSGARQMTG